MNPKIIHNTLLRGAMCSVWVLATLMGVYYGINLDFDKSLGCLFVLVVGALAHSSLIWREQEEKDEP
jgi:hypothetical protein